MMRLAMLLLAIQTGVLVRDVSVSIVFPQALRFYADVSLTLDKIASAELTITPNGRDPITVTVNPPDWIYFADQFGTKLSFLWTIPDDYPPLPLFSEVEYEWTFTSTDGESGALAGTFTFTDERLEWVRAIDPDGSFSVTTSRSLSPLIDTLRHTHALLEANTGSRTDYNLLIYPGTVTAGCVPDPNEPDRNFAAGADGIRIDCDPAFEEAMLAGYRVVYVPRGASAEEYLVNLLVEDAYARFWNGKSVPAWFSSGLAQFYAPTPNNRLLPPVQQAARSGGLYSLAEMNTMQDSALWQAQAFGMTLYLIDHITPEGAYELARVNGENFQAVYDRLMDIPLTGLIPAWQQWIFTRAAESVYGITPYQPATLTPTATPTPSSTPTPTPTPTPMPTITLTPSVTPRGVRTYVAPPSVTPSLTFTLPPPSVTPRPPGSLPTITPTPTELQAFVDQPDVRLSGAAVVAVVLVVILFLLVRTGIRR